MAFVNDADSPFVLRNNHCYFRPWRHAGGYNVVDDVALRAEFERVRAVAANGRNKLLAMEWSI